MKKQEQKKGRKFILARAALMLFVALFAHNSAWAQNTTLSIVGRQATIVQYSTLYVGEVVLNGQQSFYYLYSEDMTNNETLFANVRDALSVLKDGKYSALVPNMVWYSEEVGIAVCSNTAYESMMNADWKSADKAGLACLPNTTVKSSSSENLFETNTDFAAMCVSDFEDYYEGATLVDDVGQDAAVSGILGWLSTVNTDTQIYTVENGVLRRHINRFINHTCESITVIYTKVELESPLIELAANEDNSEVINNAADDGGVFNVKLCDRTLYKDGTWNTLCLPFSLDEDQIETMLESPKEIKTLSSTEFDPETGTLTLNFEEVTAIEAGHPYIIKWDPSENSDNSDNSENSDNSDYSESSELKNPTFSGVTLSNTLSSIVTEYAEFIGTTSPVTLEAGDRTVLYLGANNTLYTPSVDKVVKSCYAYFELKGGITAGDKASQVRAFRLRFNGGEATAIGNIAGTFTQEDKASNDWFTPDGRRMTGRPTAKGIYINKGQKLIIK